VVKRIERIDPAWGEGKNEQGKAWPYVWRKVVVFMERM
jgi:hypothetical protein